MKKYKVELSDKYFLELLKIKDADILDIRLNHFEGGNIEMVLQYPKGKECSEGGYPWPRNIENLREHNVSVEEDCKSLKD